MSWGCRSPKNSYSEVLYDFKSSKVLHQKGVVQGNGSDTSDGDNVRQQVMRLAKDRKDPIQEEAKTELALDENINLAGGERVAAMDQNHES